MSRLIGDYCESPYLSLVPRRGEGSIVAGRPLSADHQILYSYRAVFRVRSRRSTRTIRSPPNSIAYRDIGRAEVRRGMQRSGSAL